MTTTEVALTDQVISDDSPPPAPKPRRRGRIVLASILVGALAVAGAVTGVTLYNQATHDAAAEAARIARYEYGQAENANGGAASQLSRDLTRGAEVDAQLTELLAATAYFDAAKLASVDDARQPLLQLLEAAGITAEDETVAPIVALYPAPTISREIDATQTTSSLEGTAEQWNKLAAAIEGDTADKKDSIAAVQDAVDAAEASLTALATSAPTTAAAVLSAAPSATQETKDALQNALDELKNTDNKLPALLAYVAAATALQASHTAVETQRAIDAANAAGAPTYTDPSTGQQVPNPSYGGGSTGGGGGTGGGGTGGGGGQPAYTDADAIAAVQNNYGGVWVYGNCLSSNYGTWGRGGTPPPPSLSAGFTLGFEAGATSTGGWVNYYNCL